VAVARLTPIRVVVPAANGEIAPLVGENLRLRQEL
jgi:hypothetical protein